MARNWKESGHSLREGVPGPTKKNADGHTVEETGPGRFRRGRLAVPVEPDDAGSSRATAAHSSHGCIAISRQRNGKHSRLTAGADTLGDFAGELKCGVDLSREGMVRRDFFTVKLDTDSAEQAFQSQLENPLRTAAHALAAVAGIVRRKNHPGSKHDAAAILKPAYMIAVIASAVLSGAASIATNIAPARHRLLRTARGQGTLLLALAPWSTSSSHSRSQTPSFWAGPHFGKQMRAPAPTRGNLRSRLRLECSAFRCKSHGKSPEGIIRGMFSGANRT